MSDPIKTNPNQSIQPSQGIKPTQAQTSASAAGQANRGSFAERLHEAQVKFSSHAQQRLDVRAISMDDQSMKRLSSAVDKAAAHGARESLILMDDLAFIVNVRERMVVTTVDMNKKKEGVFTQIDTVVFAEKDKKDVDGTTSGSQQG